MEIVITMRHCSTVTSCIKDMNSNKFILIKLVKIDEIVHDCNRYSNETVTLRKHVTKYENMQKLIIIIKKNW